jgi:hypothetical protein
MKKMIWLFIFCLAILGNAFGQTKEITSEEYYQPFRDAFKKGRDISHRNITRKENYQDGKLRSTEEFIDEFVGSDKRRYVHIEKLTDRTRKIELIKIGTTFYCRRDDGEWKRSANWCADGSASGLSNIVSSKFTVEKGKLNSQNVKLYEQYTTYKNVYSPDKDKEGLSYWQNRFWLDDQGFMVQEEIISGLLEPERLYWKQTETYEYNPKDLKIEAPLK